MNEKRKLDWTLMLMVFLSIIVMGLMSAVIDRSSKVCAPSEALQVEVAQTEVPQTEVLQPDAAASGIIRFHIRANSDTEEDQKLKLKVRNQVLAKVQSYLMEDLQRRQLQQGIENSLLEAQRLQLTRQWIQSNLDTIEDWAEEAVQEEGYDYPVTASMGITWIPQRQYDGLSFPAGNYEALTLNIGQGTGQNWWCVLFPPLCLIDCGDELAKARLDAALGDRIVLKSRILEILKSMKAEESRRADK